MNKKELIQVATAQSGMSQAEMEKALNALTTVIGQSLKREESVMLIGFGTFSVKERIARNGHNPSTGQTIQIPAKKVVKFKPGSGLDIETKK